MPLQEINKKVVPYQKTLEEKLPPYTFAYEEGDRYIKTEYMVSIENQVSKYRIHLLESSVISR